MARPKTLKRARDEEEDEVASEEEVPKPTKKTVKKAKTTATTAATGEPATDADGNKYWTLSNNRRVNISEFKGKVLINIREYYTDQVGELKPGRKGISLGLDQYNALIKAIPSISAQLNKDGHETAEIPSTTSDAAADRPSSSSSSSSKESKKPKEKPKKSNIEATSDEDEEED